LGDPLYLGFVEFAESDWGRAPVGGEVVARGGTVVELGDVRAVARSGRGAAAMSGGKLAWG
jgi:hypothetical protein